MRGLVREATDMLRDASEAGHWLEDGSNLHAHTDEAAELLADEYGITYDAALTIADALLRDLADGA